MKGHSLHLNHFFSFDTLEWSGGSTITENGNRNQSKHLIIGKVCSSLRKMCNIIYRPVIAQEIVSAS